MWQVLACAPMLTREGQRPCPNCISYFCSRWWGVTLTVKVEATAVRRRITITAAVATVPATRLIMSVTIRNGDGKTRVRMSRGNTTRPRLTRHCHPRQRRPLLFKIGKHLRTLVFGRTNNEQSSVYWGSIAAPPALSYHGKWPLVGASAR